MRIIRQGKRYGLKKCTTDCDKCGTIFEFLEHEAKFVPDNRDGNYYEVKCPVCPHKFTVAATLLK